jgi:hypothetical protein
MKERLYAKQMTMILCTMKERTHHDLDHHAPISTMKIRASKRINQLGQDGRDEKHGHAHGAQVGKDAGGGKDDHAV